MKYIYPAIIQLIIQYFKGISHNIETDQQAFIFVTFYRKIISGGTKCPMNIGFGYTMLKGRWFAYYIRFHKYTNAVPLLLIYYIGFFGINTGKSE